MTIDTDYNMRRFNRSMEDLLLALDDFIDAWAESDAHEDDDWKAGPMAYKLQEELYKEIGKNAYDVRFERGL